ncbi:MULTISPECIES: hypothetical protein [unclassified Bacillus (in: firmicutes)]|uniref:hypothetical protein n=1 Tax=unclassified Bacillus (in: firmicutes) TaxID=185979 RepID=UPI000C779ECB|nr:MULTISPECIES: hypothetical protein [unclassified Bacillus (in: firmicutes)]MDT0160456.1 hypothetical protein [Bacillus sp. AG4(2022)]PLR72177.1 hypothetical protein CYJ37_11515 [Bacillus sp. UMB0728]
MNFDNWQERIEEIKQLWECEWSTVGMSTHVRHADVGWLLEFIEAQRKLIESYGRVTEGMTESKASSKNDFFNCFWCGDIESHDNGLCVDCQIKHPELIID